MLGILRGQPGPPGGFAGRVFLDAHGGVSGGAGFGPRDRVAVRRLLSATRVSGMRADGEPAGGFDALKDAEACRSGAAGPEARGKGLELEQGLGASARPRVPDHEDEGRQDPPGAQAGAGGGHGDRGGGRRDGADDGRRGHQHAQATLSGSPFIHGLLGTYQRGIIRSQHMCRRMLLVLCTVALFGSCVTSDQRSGFAYAKLTDGRVVADLLDSTARSVVLVYSPSDCLACGGVLIRWLQASRDLDLEVNLLLTSKPSAAESVPFAFLRLDVAGFLAPNGPAPATTPASYLFRGMQLADSAFDPRSQLLLIDKISRRLDGAQPDRYQPSS